MSDVEGRFVYPTDFVTRARVLFPLDAHKWFHDRLERNAISAVGDYLKDRVHPGHVSRREVLDVLNEGLDGQGGRQALITFRDSLVRHVDRADQIATLHQEWTEIYGRWLASQS